MILIQEHITDYTGKKNYQKNILILLTQKVDQYTFSAYRPNFFFLGGGGVVEEIIKFWPNLEICGRIHIL